MTVLDLPLTFPDHLDLLERLVEEDGYKFVAVDFGVAVLGDGNADKQQDVSAAFTPFVKKMRALGVTSFVIVHRGKGGKDRSLADSILGSVGWRTVFRHVLGVLKVDETTFVFGRVEGNQGRPPKPVEYGVKGENEETAGIVVVWGRERDESMEAIYRDLHHSKRPESKQDDCARWLAEFLKRGAVAASTVYAMAEEHGWSEDTVKRAGKGLSIVKVGAGRNTAWRLPRPDEMPKLLEVVA